MISLTHFKTVEWKALRRKRIDEVLKLSTTTLVRCGRHGYPLSNPLG